MAQARGTRKKHEETRFQHAFSWRKETFRVSLRLAFEKISLTTHLSVDPVRLFDGHDARL